MGRHEQQGGDAHDGHDSVFGHSQGLRQRQVLDHGTSWTFSGQGSGVTDPRWLHHITELGTKTGLVLTSQSRRHSAREVRIVVSLGWLGPTSRLNSVTQLLAISLSRVSISQKIHAGT